MTESVEQQNRLIAGRYRLGSALGRGGMGAVWRAQDELLGREVAIKEVLLPAELPESEKAVLRERTLREARTAARISHPSVVGIHDVVQDGGRPWIVMELVDSVSLSELIRSEGALPPERVAAIGLDMLSALEAAHRAGVLHRDVKPSNVLLARDGRTVLTDFGIATLEGDTQLTSTGLVVGSPEYIAPERARGEPPGPEADLWSLGATLYAAVEGRSPYVRSGPLPTLSAVMTDPPDPIRRAGPLAPVLNALLTKDPHSRIGGPQARKMLEGVVTGMPTGAVAPPHLQPPPGPTALFPGGATTRGPVAPGPSRPPTGAPPGGPPPRPTTGTPSGPPPGRPGGMGGSAFPPAPPTAGFAPPPAAGRRRRSRTLPIVAGVVVIAVVAAVAYFLLSGGKKNNPNAAGNSSQPAASTSTIPAGWSQQQDQAGSFTVAVPAGWTSTTPTAKEVDYGPNDGSGVTLRITWNNRPDPDPVSALHTYAATARQRSNGYKEVSPAQAVACGGNHCAELEFTFVSSQDGTTTMHERVRDIVVQAPAASGGTGLAYSITLLTPQRQWQTDEGQYWQTVLSSFTPGTPAS